MLNKKLLLGSVTVSLIVVISTVFASSDHNSKSTSENSMDSKVTISKYEVIRYI